MGDREQMVSNFKEAGFDEERAEHGAQMMESGRYFGFADAATSLVYFGPGATPETYLTEHQRTRIEEVARRVDKPDSSSASAQNVSEGAEKITLDKGAYDRLLSRSDRLRELEERKSSGNQSKQEDDSGGRESLQVDEAWAEIDDLLGLGGSS